MRVAAGTFLLMLASTFIATALTTGQRNLITFGVVTDWLHDLNYGTFFINVKKKGEAFRPPPYYEIKNIT